MTTGTEVAPTGPVPVRGVLFDLHSTLVDQGDAATWLDLALARCGHEALPETDRPALLAFLDRIWENARVHDPDSLRDLSPEDHERVFHTLLAEGPDVDRTLGDALYATLLDTWVAYDDAAPVLRALRAAGVRTVVLSNVGVDVRHVLGRDGLLDLVDGVVLSCEVGVVKPEPGIFAAGLDLLGVPADEALMVGDSGKDDAGAAALGIRTLILPRTRGPVHGLAAVLRLLEV